MTKEQRKISDHNNHQAWKYFGYSRNDHKGLILHHIDPELQYNDIERYIQWKPEDLVVMTREEHASLHHKGTKKSEETKRKMSIAQKSIPHNTKYWLGKERDADTRKKISEKLIKHKVRCIETQVVYESSKQVERELGIANVNKVCNGQRPLAGGYHWEYVDD